MHATHDRTRRGTDLEEADVLRAAAAIHDLLSDGRLHPWGDCIDLAEELTTSRKHAGTLAFAAITTVMGDIPMLWAGPRGERWLALLPSRERTLSIDCPRCGARVASPCLRSDGKPRKSAHRERERAVVDPGGVLAAS
jgi:hypothetical protein